MITEEKNKQISSRICVKKLPKFLELNELKSHFSHIGEITDAKLILTKKGTTRLGFIGYRTEKQAEEAIKFLNNSCIKTSRITCEFAWINGDPNIPRPWSRYSKKVEKSGNRRKLVYEKRGSKIEKENDDPKLQEFLQIMQPCSKRKIWADDLEIPTPKRVCSVSKLAGDSAITDLDYFRSRIRKDRSNSESDTDEPACQNQEQQDSRENIDSKEQECLLKGGLCDASMIPGNASSHLQFTERKPQSSRVFVWGIPYAASDDEVAEFFNKFGNVKEVHLVLDRETKQPKGFGFVLYNSPEEAARALGDHIFQGRKLHVIEAENKHKLHNSETQVTQSKGKTYKQQREDKRKASEANGDTRAWNSLFMRTDTVVENIARKFGVSKSVILDPEADDVAVRVALGEAIVIAETKKALEKAGVNVASLEEFASGKSTNRSNHIILVKNLPFSSCEVELSKMFGSFGSLDKVIFPSTRTMALVSFVEAAEARSAFRGLSYKPYSGSLLYLEWAPDNILCQNLMPNNDSRNDRVCNSQEAKSVLLEEQYEEMGQCEIDSDEPKSRTLYVNLDFRTTDEKLEKHFREHMNEGQILSVRVVKQEKDGKHVSSGYGFVNFDSVCTATKAFRALKGTTLDGRELKLHYSRPKENKSVVQKSTNGCSPTTLIVKNVPFGETKKSIRDLFSPFGQVKSVRLPQKMENNRGFGFVEYCTKQEARNAIKALSSAHSCGRHLVIEFAKQPESLEELRAKTAAQFTKNEAWIQNPIRITKQRKLKQLFKTKTKFIRV